MATVVDRGAPSVTDGRPRSLASIAAWWSRSIAAVRYALPALASYIAVRAVGVLVLLIWVRDTNSDFATRLARADAAHYLIIATQGYDAGLTDGGPSNLAFFPLYPRL